MKRLAFVFLIGALVIMPCRVGMADVQDCINKYNTELIQDVAACTLVFLGRLAVCRGFRIYKNPFYFRNCVTQAIAMDKLCVRGAEDRHKEGLARCVKEP